MAIITGNAIAENISAVNVTPTIGMISILLFMIHHQSGKSIPIHKSTLLILRLSDYCSWLVRYLSISLAETSQYGRYSDFE